jgi:hypothetical protein
MMADLSRVTLKQRAIVEPDQVLIVPPIRPCYISTARTGADTTKATRPLPHGLELPTPLRLGGRFRLMPD